MNPPLHRRLRMGLVGGAGSGFIGRVHVTAATLDGRAELVAGAFSSQPDKSRAAAAEFGVDPRRAYGSYAELLAAESRLPPEQRIDFLTIATPNDTHFPIAEAALRAGLHVLCEKPLTIALQQAETLVRRVADAGAVFAVAHAYSGYPLVRQARAMARGGALGELQAVRVQYIQGGLRSLEPGKPPARAAWKADPAKTGPAGTLSDIGTHAYHLARFVTGLMPQDVSCHLRHYHPARPLDDYGHAVVRFVGGALGTFTFSQVTHGRLNDLVIEVDGTAGSLSWRQESPDELVVRRFGQPVRVYERNPRTGDLDPTATRLCRLPGGHPEGLLEAFANLYRDAFDDMLGRRGPWAPNADPAGRDATHVMPPPCESLYPDVASGLEGVLFVEQCLASSRTDGAFQPLAHALIRR